MPGLHSHDLHRHGRRGQLNFFFSLLHDDRCNPLYASSSLPPFLPRSSLSFFLFLSPSHPARSDSLSLSLSLSRCSLNAREDRAPRIPRLPVYAFARVCAQFASHRGEIERRFVTSKNRGIASERFTLVTARYRRTRCTCRLDEVVHVQPETSTRRVEFRV